jgi:hypothetical protein
MGVIPATRIIFTDENGNEYQFGPLEVTYELPEITFETGTLSLNNTKTCTDTYTAFIKNKTDKISKALGPNYYAKNGKLFKK